MLDLKPGEQVLDVCGGTGDLSILAARKTGCSGRVVLYDINRAMMDAGRQKIQTSGLACRITGILGDAEKLPFADDRFDDAMVGFGIRNVPHMKKGLIEMHRILKLDGILSVYEPHTGLEPGAWKPEKSIEELTSQGLFSLQRRDRRILLFEKMPSQ